MNNNNKTFLLLYWLNVSCLNQETKNIHTRMYTYIDNYPLSVKKKKYVIFTVGINKINNGHIINNNIFWGILL